MLVKLKLLLCNGGKVVAMMCPDSLFELESLLGKVIIINESVEVQLFGMFNHTYWQGNI